MKRHFFRMLVMIFLGGSFCVLNHQKLAAQSVVKKVVLQGFWWDYWNSNFPNAWSNYLAELAPRLKAIGVDAVWVPPAYKNQATSKVGYSPFDHYDLGDKFQKGGSGGLTIRTRMGSKDELLRMIAVMHANGIEAIEDIVLNHADGAGNNNGQGGRDPESSYSTRSSDGYKNFRYVSYSTPLINDGLDDYWTRTGRWPKNFPNFYPNQFNNCTTGNICEAFFGPDICYDNQAYGRSSNIPTSGSVSINGTVRPYHNPEQSSNYMLNNGRDWIMWLKKQTDFDGWRWDAVKHFPLSVQEDYTYQTKYIVPPFARGGEAMFSVGEWIGGKDEIDAYVNNLKGGTNEIATGSFDLSLRGYGANGGIYSMVMGQGGFFMQNLVDDQQFYRYWDYSGKRVHRTSPFVNSHDTFRPILNSNGNYSKPLGDNTGWDTNFELGGNGQHIDPREPRLYAAYATIFAMDGNPIVFFEDLFDIGNTGKRYSHLPSNQNDLPVRPDLVNIIQCHQKLAFKNGDYAVPTKITGSDAPFYQKGSAGNHLVIERKGQAVIGITDAYSITSGNNDDQEVWVTVSNSLKNKLLIDYSGAHGISTTQVFGDGRVLIKTAPAGHTIPGARGHGYSIWAPIPQGVTFSKVQDLYEYIATYTPGRETTTTQEWEMANDLGDSHPNSLKQGGTLPSNSTSWRTVGRIFVQSGKVVNISVFPEVNGRNQTVQVLSGNNVLGTKSGISSNTNPLQASFTASNTGWHTVKIRNTNTTTPGMRVWVNVTYTAPLVVNTRSGAGVVPEIDDSQTELIADDHVRKQSGVMVFPNPAIRSVELKVKGMSSQTVGVITLYTNSGSMVFQKSGTLEQMNSALNAALQELKSSIYIIHVVAPRIDEHISLIKE